MEILQLWAAFEPSTIICQEALSYARDALTFLGSAPVIGSAAFAVRVAERVVT